MFIETSDLTPFADIDVVKAQAMIDDAEAMAVTVAPCLVDPEDDTVVSPDLGARKLATIKAILRGAILRWNDIGSGGTIQQTAGPFSQTVDTSKVRRGMFWPSEIEQLQQVCSTNSGGGAWAVSMLPAHSPHRPWCALLLGAEYCSCGVDIAGVPIFEEA